MSNYPRANQSAAWYQDNYPGALMDPNCGVLHTTEGTTLPSYGGGATAPTYTAVPVFSEERFQWFAHFPDERSARALVNASGGVETNTANAIQVELVGTCAPGSRDLWKRSAPGRPFIFWPDPPAWALRDLARFLVYCKDRHGIPLRGPEDARWKAYPESYGAGGQRFSASEWRAFKGWCGHQHVPENYHGDPGNFPWGRLEALARELDSAPSKKPDPEPDVQTPRWDEIFVLAGQILRSDPAPGKLATAQEIQKLARRYSVEH